jgi:hypothetical protein
MKNAKGEIDRDAGRVGSTNAEMQKSQRLTAEEEPRATNQLDVRFVEEPHWSLALKAANGSASRMARTAHLRVLTLSEYAGIARHESDFDSALARKVAWAIVRVRAAANCLGLV